MDKRVLLLACFLIGTLTLAVAAAGFVSAQAGLSAYSGSTIADSEIDGTIGEEWDDAGRYTNVTLNPAGTADLWIKHDETYMYIALSFTADSNNPWVGFQFVGGNCMVADADGALFGHDKFSADGYHDIFFGDMPVIGSDGVQDGVGTFNVDSLNNVVIELKKPLRSGDAAGRDVAWAVGDERSILIMWDSDAGGSSGGNTSHRVGNRAANTILINPEPIPEISTFGIIVMLIAALALMLIFKVKQGYKHSPRLRTCNYCI